MAKFFIALFGIMIALSPVFAATWYVETNGNDSAAGTNWVTAKKTIQCGVNAAGNGDIVLVTNGEYFLSAQITVSNAVTVRSFKGPDVTIVNGQSSNRCFYLGTDCHLEGFTVNNGYVTNAYGGGVYCVSADNVITNCVIEGNTADMGSGGGVFYGTLNNCVLATNTVGKYGGGAFGSILNNCTLISNTAVYGGGAHGSTLSNCTLNGNSVYDGGGGANGCTLYNCGLTNNSAIYGGGVYNSTLTNSTLSGNTASDGGGAYGGTLNNCTLMNNTATIDGGGAYDSTLNNCTLSGNTAANDGGGARSGTLNNCALINNTATADGGGAYFATLNNCKLSDNTAEAGGGTFFGTLNNCTLSKNTAALGSGNFGSTLNNCIVYYNYGIPQCYSSATMRCTCAPDASSGNGNITSEPLFVDKNGGDYRLAAGSPCINVGDNQYAPTNVTPVDLDGNTRIWSGTVDMGAYENLYVPMTPTNIAASDGIYTDKVQVTWSSATNATGYQVWRHTADMSTSATQIVTTTEITYDDTEAAAGTNYYYWVKSENSYGASAFSSNNTGYRSVSSVSTNRRVLLVGLDNYSPYYGPTPLNTCSNDAVGMRNLFFLGDPSNHWLATNMTLYIDQQATKTAIRGSLNALATASGAGDLTVYVHSSHGGTSGGSNTFICTYDANYTDAELAADLTLFRTDTKVIVILDACYSGGMFKSDGTPESAWLFAERVMEHYRNIQQSRFKRLGPQDPKTLGLNIAFMTACDYDEYSYTSDFYSRYMGYLIQGCSVQSVDTNNNGELSFGELHEYASTNAMAEVPTQHAQSFNPTLLDSTIARIIDPGTTNIIYNDFDGDGTSDVAVFHPGTGHWRIFSLSRSMFLACEDFEWGGPGFKPFDGDYDGDRATDLNVYNTTSGEWRIGSLKRGTVLVSSEFFGGADATPVSGDYDGDRISDAALCQQPDGYWYILSATTGTRLTWGQSHSGAGFIPVSGDFDGDQCNDLAMYHVTQGTWYIFSLAKGADITWGKFWGGTGLVPVSGDYDGDGYSDLAVCESATGLWYIWSLHRDATIAYGIEFGGPSFIPVPGDYDGDGYSDLAVYQPSTGNWYIGSLRRMVMIASGELGGPDYIPVLPTW
ncbi:MAG: FG-GAP-like repeat-containing protein [Verrucomicrobiota bacterium]